MPQPLAERPAPCAALLLVALLVAFAATEAAAAATKTFRATADAYVHSSRAKTNFGKSRTIRADASPVLRGYLRFSVPTLSGTITKATLRVRAASRSAAGLTVRPVASTTWGERSITYRNAPAVGSALASRIRTAKGSWSSADVTSFVRGNGAVSFAVTTGATAGLRLLSREAGLGLAPRLVIETSEATASPPPPALAPPSPQPIPRPGSPSPTPPPGVGDPAPTCIGEPANHPLVAYPEPRVFLEAQGWWDDRDDDGHVARFGDSEHLHIGLCFPLQQTVSGPIRLDVRVVGHNLPPGSVIRNTRFHDAPGTLFEDVRYERTVAAGEMDVAVWKTLTWDSSEAPDGLRELRFLTFVERPDGAEIHASTGWCTDVQNGRPDTNHDSCTRRLTEGRGWYDCLEYKSSRTDEWTYPYAGIPAGQAYTVPLSGQDGAPFGGGGDDHVTRHWLRLDPNFHSADVGTSIAEHAGPHRYESVTVPGHLLTPGVHVLFVMTERDGLCTRTSSGTVFSNQQMPQDGILSGGLRIPIQVN